MRRPILSLLALASIALSGTASAAELITNGGFEFGSFNPTVPG